MDVVRPARPLLFTSSMSIMRRKHRKTNENLFFFQIWGLPKGELKRGIAEPEDFCLGMRGQL